MCFNAEFLEKFEIRGGLGESISHPFGINRCKKSECLKTGQQRDSGRDETGAVVPLKENKQARHLRQPHNGSNTASRA